MKSPVNMIKHIIKWAVITAITSDDKDFPIHQIDYLDKIANAFAWYPFGFHANPGNTTLAVVLSVGGNSENRVVFPGSPKERLDVNGNMPTPLKEGEVVMYHPATKSYLHFLQDGTIDIDSQKDVNIRVAGNMLADVEGNLTADVEGILDVDVKGITTIDGIADVKITAPNLIIAGNVDITGKLELTGAYEQTGTFEQTGNADLGLSATTVNIGGLGGNSAARDQDNITTGGTPRIIQGSSIVKIAGTPTP